MISSKVIARLGLVLLVVSGAVIAFLYRDALNIETISEGINGRLAPLLFVIAYAAAAVFFLPGSLFGLAGGALFGPVWGTLWNLCGALAGAGFAFLIARHVAGDWVKRRAAGRLGELVKGIESEGWRFVAFVRLVPVFPFNLLNYALGLTQISFRHYMIASALAMFPGTLLYTWIGYAGREALIGGQNMPELIIITIALVAVILYIPRIVRRFREKQTQWIDTSGLRQLISTPGNAVVVDVRGKQEFQRDGLPKALNIPLPELPQRLDEISEHRDNTVVLVCQTHIRSKTAAEQLTRAGFTNTRVLRGGMQAWHQVTDST